MAVQIGVPGMHPSSSLSSPMEIRPTRLRKKNNQKYTYSANANRPEEPGSSRTSIVRGAELNLGFAFALGEHSRVDMTETESVKLVWELVEDGLHDRRNLENAFDGSSHGDCCHEKDAWRVSF